MEDQPPVESKPVHPLPGFCWMWLLAGILLAVLGGMIVLSSLFPGPRVLSMIVPGDARFIEMGSIGLAGHGVGLGYVWFWQRFAVERNLTRRTWHIGTGLLILGGLFLFFTGWLLPAMGFFLTIAVWAQGNTRKYFERT